MRRLFCALALVAALAAGCSSGPGERRPAAAVPDDLCTVVDLATWEKIVPRTQFEALPQVDIGLDSNVNKARCMATAGSSGAPGRTAGDDAVVTVDVRLRRAGTEPDASASQRAKRWYENSCDDLPDLVEQWQTTYGSALGEPPRTIDGVGDHACGVMVWSMNAGRMMYQVKLYALRGGDLLEIFCVRYSNASTAVERDAADLAKSMLASLD